MAEEPKSQLGQAIRQRDIYTALVNTEAWTEFDKFLAAQIETRLIEMTGRHSADVGELLGKEGLAGEIRALRFIRKMPEVAVADAKAVIAGYRSQEEESEDA